MAIFCPACKRLNETSTTNCIFCGVALTGIPETPHTALLPETDMDALMQEMEAKFVRRLSAPEKGIAIYSSNDPTPIAVQESQEFVLGRKSATAGAEELVDLTALRGYEEGVSHRHARIRRTKNGYEIIDLGSTNGTWLNKKHLTANLPYPLASKDQIYLGRLSIFVLFK